MNKFHKFLLGLIGAALATPALALDYDWNPIQFRLENKFSVGMALRAQDRDAELVGRANGGQAYSTNGDDGNLAFDSGELVGGASKLTSDFTMTWRNWGLFARGSYVFDGVLNDTDYFDSADYGAGKEFDQSERERKNRQVREHVGKDADILDLYVFGALPVGDREVSLRLGRQALNWGESTFIVNGVNSLLAFDANQLRVPGFELEELLVPVPLAWFGVDLVNNLSLEAFYQLRWEPTVPDAAGTFWSSNDFIGIGGTQANLGFGRADENSPAGTPCTDGSNCVPLGSTVPRAPNREPADDGQFGLALHWYAAELNDTDFGVYAMNYHSRLPLASGTSRAGPGLTPADTASYFAEYPEDIRLYGLSFNTTVGAYAIQGEYSLKVDQPLQLDDVELLLAGLGASSQINRTPGATLGNQYIQGWRRHDVSQWDLSFTRVLGPLEFLGYDQLVVLGEAALMHVHRMPEPEELAYEAPATYTLNPDSAAANPSSAAGLPITPYDAYATETAWGYRLAARLSYNNVLGPVSLEPTLRFDHDVDGVSPAPLVNFVEGRKSIATVFGFQYLSDWRAELGYTNYFGGGARNLLNDRDFVEFNLRYAF